MNKPKPYRLICSILMLVSLVACQSSYQSANTSAVTPSSTTIATTNESTIDSSANIVSREHLSDINTSSRQTLLLPEDHDDLWARMRAGFQLSDYYQHPYVLKRLETYSNNQRFFDVISERARPFLYGIIEEIEKRQLPLELALIPIVESTFNPNAYSRQHAVGLWQFVSATGASYGLQQDWWYDGRRDPKASTIAALDFLEELYQKFDQNWLHTLAAYNTGESNVRRAIRRTKADTDDFWSLPLALETRSHIPKILALANLISNSESFGVELPPIANEEPLTLIEVGAQIDIAQAAALAEIDYSTLRKLNPGYLQWATHPDSPQLLAVPNAAAATFRRKLNSLPQIELVTWDRYQIQAGDSLGKIARLLNTRVELLQTVNNLNGSRIIAGESLLIPRNLNNDLPMSLPRAPSLRQQTAPVPAKYTVRRGDNLWAIARRFDLKSRDIASWNNFKPGDLLQPGQVLDFRTEALVQISLRELSNQQEASSTGSYVVKRGDSMAKIASLSNISLDDLLSWNNINIKQTIFPGQLLKLAAPQSGLN